MSTGHDETTGDDKGVMKTRSKRERKGMYSRRASASA